MSFYCSFLKAWKEIEFPFPKVFDYHILHIIPTIAGGSHTRFGGGFGGGSRYGNGGGFGGGSSRKRSRSR